MKGGHIVRTSVVLIFIATCCLLSYSNWNVYHVQNPLIRKVYGQFRNVSLPEFFIELPTNFTSTLSLTSDVVDDDIASAEIVTEPTDTSSNTTASGKEQTATVDNSFPLLPELGANLHGQIKPGMTITLTGVFKGGVLVLELLEATIHPELQKRFHIKSGAGAIHLHLRFGSTIAVVNSVDSGGKWQKEVKVPDPLLNAKVAPVLCTFTFAEQHLEIVCNDKPITNFTYRLNPFKIQEIRFLCRTAPGCLQDASVRYSFSAQSKDCFGKFCKETIPLPPAISSGDLPTGIKHSYFINLEHRKDRRAAIEGVLGRAGIPFERIEGINPRTHPDSDELLRGCYDTTRCPGQVGCQFSHLKALEQAMERKLEHVAIFEDDFAFQPWVDPDQVQTAVAGAMLLAPDWDVIALSLNIGKESLMPGYSVRFSAGGGTGAAVGLTRIHNAQTTGGYIVRDRMMRKIYESWLPENCHVKKDYPTAIDQCWKPLQTRHVWIAFEPQPGTQARSFSDIENRNVNYGLKRR